MLLIKGLSVKKNIALFLYLMICLLFISCSNKPPIFPKIEKGILDLRKWNFQNNGVFTIEGNASFYWKKFITLKNNIKPDCYISISNSWNNQKDKTCNFPRKGYATYYIKIIFPKDQLGKKIMIYPKHFIAYASRMVADKEIISYNGSISKLEDEATYQASRVSKNIPFVLKSSELNLFIHVSNFTHFRSGIFNPLYIGSVLQMQEFRDNRIFKNLFVIVSLLVMFFYHLFLFVVNKSQKASLYFALTCLIFATDFSLNDAMTFFIAFPEIPFEFVNRLHLSLPFFLPSAFLFFIHSLFPEEMSKRIKNLAGILTIFLTALTVFFSSDIYHYLVKPHIVYLLIVTIYIYIPIIKATKQKREGAMIFLFSYAVFSLFALNDILFLAEVIQTTNLVSTGLMIFIITLSIWQGLRQAQILNKNKALSQNLKELNIGLEKKVKERTLTIKQQSEELQRLSLFKEDMTNMIVHDLKSPLNIIINSDTISDERLKKQIIKQSALSMEQLVQNMLDVYKFNNSSILLFKTEFQLDMIIEKSVAEASFSADFNGNKIVTSIEKNIKVKADKDILKRILTNLLSNAVKYSDYGKEINIIVTSQNNQEILIKIINYGENISENMQNIIFDKFEQAQLNIKRKFHSSGLGLTFCKMAVESHGGKIGFNKVHDRQIEFWFTLPNHFL